MTKKLPKPDEQIQQLLGAGRIKAILSEPKKKSWMSGMADIILFDDGQTYISLEEQDYYTYHDCATSARHIVVRQDRLLWEMYNKDYIPATHFLY